MGGIEGLVSGVALALREQGGRRSDRDRRVVAVLVGCVGWALVGVVVMGGSGTSLGAVVLVLAPAATGSTAGALLAPCVVNGRQLHE